jgi:hypothetical protein
LSFLPPPYDWSWRKRCWHRWSSSWRSSAWEVLLPGILLLGVLHLAVLLVVVRMVPLGGLRIYIFLVQAFLLLVVLAT